VLSNPAVVLALGVAYCDYNVNHGLNDTFLWAGSTVLLEDHHSPYNLCKDWGSRAEAMRWPQVPREAEGTRPKYLVVEFRQLEFHQPKQGAVVSIEDASCQQHSREFTHQDPH
jgi:hypothetical protein